MVAQRMCLFRGLYVGGKPKARNAQTAATNSEH